MAFTNPLNIAADVTAQNYGSTNFAAYGNTYLVWGTDWASNTGLIITKAVFKDRIVDFKTEQGAGFTALVVKMKDGDDIDLEWIETTQFAPLTINTVYSIVSPLGVVQCVLKSQEATYAPKTEGRRACSFENFTLITLAGGTPV